MMGDVRQKQQRPSVLCRVSQPASRRESRAGGSACKTDEDEAQPAQMCSPESSSSAGQSRELLLLNTDQWKLSSRDARMHDGSLFVKGACRWPGCELVTPNLHSFLTHLHCEHAPGERSFAQWRVQQDVVQCLETQLLQEKQKLLAMQQHLCPHGSAQLPPATEGHRDHQASHGGSRAAAAAHLPDLLSSTDCYKHHNIRPPYTYAHLIRWSILDSPGQQSSLSQIYDWFSSRFFYFRHNSATWKNAVRHNLSLHRCFVRVEGGKGAVWTVDEDEFQKRRRQKYHREDSVHWSFPHQKPGSSAESSASAGSF